jgi:hypothetical protein
MLCFANISPSTMAQCDTLPDTPRQLLFNLNILHTAIVLTESIETLINFECMLEALVGACLGKEALGQVILGVEVSV